MYSYPPYSQAKPQETLLELVDTGTQMLFLAIDNSQNTALRSSFDMRLSSYRHTPDFDRIRTLFINMLQNSFFDIKKVPKILMFQSDFEFQQWLRAKYNLGLNNEQIKTEAYVEIEKFKEYIINPTSDDFTIDVNMPFTHESIEKCITKARKRLDETDYDGAITIARTLTETIIEIIQNKLSSKKIPYDGKLARYYKLMVKELELDPDKRDLEENLAQFLVGLYGVVQGISSLRNIASDAHPKKTEPKPHEAKLVVNSAFVLCEFLCEEASNKNN